ncbi:hypothetical protein [Mycoplasma procyoni]|uniref:hypothetical protein n=1 Tax=Mycoplasma procyoni TaxID=568784 RepID=UPI00197C642F|nr:hypothetical protein [Mycoplasma procyoni]MBN3534731.1 hypothetical protein [Mycoplasma procyoni]
MTKITKKQQKKQDFLDYIVYKIFSSKYSDNFILEGSEAILIKSQDEIKSKKVFFRLPDDLDLNLISIEKHYQAVFDLIKDIFKNDSQIQIKLRKNNFDRNNHLVISISIPFKNSISVDIIHDQNIYKIEKEPFVYKDQTILVNTYDINKYIANKIVSFRKVPNESFNKSELNHWLDQFESNKQNQITVDLWWLVLNFNFDHIVVAQYLELMFKQKDFKSLKIDLSEYLDYIINYLSLEITKKGLIEFLNNRRMLVFFESFDQNYNFFISILKKIRLELNDVYRFH